MNVRAVVFDLDGTLLDSLEDIADAANAILSAQGFATHDVKAYRYFVGDGVRRLVQRTVPASARDDLPLIDQLIQEFTARYQQTWNAKSRLYEGIPELLNGLSARQINAAILSNKPQAATQQCVDHFLSAWSFAAVLGQHAGRPPKPDLTGVHEIVQLLQVQPHACLYLGDTGVDMQTARLSGMIPIGAAWGFREVEELTQAGAHAVIDHPLQLLEVIDPCDKPGRLQ